MLIHWIIFMHAFQQAGPGHAVFNGKVIQCLKQFHNLNSGHSCNLIHSVYHSRFMLYIASYTRFISWFLQNSIWASLTNSTTSIRHGRYSLIVNTDIAGSAWNICKCIHNTYGCVINSWDDSYSSLLSLSIILVLSLRIVLPYRNEQIR